MYYMKRVYLCLLLVFSLTSCEKQIVWLTPTDIDSASYHQALQERADYEQRIRWFRDAKYGVFIHWNPSSVAGVEISFGRDCHPIDGSHVDWGNTPKISVEEYDNLYKQFNPTEFNAESWVQKFIELGFKYIVFVTKHHDGFCMFDNPYTDYKICSSESPVQYDITKQIVDACHKYGMRVGLYYSLIDWHYPDYYTYNHYKYIQYLHNQVQWLLSQYGNIDILWCDCGTPTENFDMHSLYTKIITLQPKIILNNRLGGYKYDFWDIEGYAGAFSNDYVWERTGGIHQGWSYRTDQKVYTTSQVFKQLFDTWGNGGNMILGLGPRANGSLDPEQMKPVNEVGEWLKKYGECVYKTAGGPYYNYKFGWSTCKDSTFYLIINNAVWQKNTLELPKLPANVLEFHLITEGKVEFEELSDVYKFTIKNNNNSNYSIIKCSIDKIAINLFPINGNGG